MPKSKKQYKEFVQTFKNFLAYIPKRIPSMQVIEKDGLMLIDAGIPDENFNCVISQRPVAFEEIIAYFRRKDFPFTWWLGEGQIEELQAEPAQTLMARNLPSDHVDFDLTFDPLRAAHILAPQSETLHWIFDRANLTPNGPYLPMICDGGTATLFIDHDKAFISDLITLPQVRHHGLATTLVRKLMEIAHARGCQSVEILCAQELESFYEELGFSQMRRVYPFR